jgi:hypothetical protein
MQVPIPINEAEAIVEPFWDRRISPLPKYTVIPNGEESPGAPRLAAGGVSSTLPEGNLDAAGRRVAADGTPAPDDTGNPYGARAFQFWCWTTLAWDSAPVDRPVLSFSRSLEVDLAGYDTLIVRLAAAPHVRLTVRADIDGRERTLIDRRHGTGEAREYEAPLGGRVMRRLSITLESGGERAEEAWLGWIGVADAGRRAAMLARPNHFSPAWESELLPPGAAVDFVPRLSIVFDARELEAVRARALSPLYRPLMDQLRERARQAMAYPRSPEDQVGVFHATSQWKLIVRERERDYRPFFIDAPICAFVGLVDRDPAISRFAARIAMSLAYTDHWHYSFQQGFPGSTWDIRGFPESMVSHAVALAADWAGCWLTPDAEHLLRFAIATKGLPKAREVMLQWEYLWDCNQSHMIGIGRILGLLAVERGWPRTRDDIDQFERDTAEMTDRYVQPDGSTHEGVGYWSNTFRATLPGLAALARYRGKRLADLVPPRLASTWTYIGTLLSTAGEPGSYLPIADTVGNRIALDAIAGMADAFDGPWSGLLGSCLINGRVLNHDWTHDGIFTIVHGPDRCPRPSVEVPVFSRLATAGLISSNRPWPRRGGAHGGTVRLFLVGAMAGAGHGHRDKGSFILEADGETFALDRGMTPYEDAGNVPFLKSEEAHNLAVPEGCFQANPSAHAAAWNGDGDDVRLSAAIDTGKTWLPPVLACRRTIESPRPDLIEIVDVIELAETRAVRFLLHSGLAVETAGTGARLTGERSVLTVTAAWAEAADAEACGVDWSYAPVSRIVLLSAPARRHTLRTVVELARR